MQLRSGHVTLLRAEFRISCSFCFINHYAVTCWRNIALRCPCCCCCCWWWWCSVIYRSWCRSIWLISLIASPQSTCVPATCFNWPAIIQPRYVDKTKWKTRRPAVARIADRTAWQHAIIFLTQIRKFLCVLKFCAPYFERIGVRRVSAMVPLDRALISFYRLSIVTMSLTEAVWPQFAMRVFGVQSVSPFGENGGVGSANLYHGVTVGQPYLLLQTVLR